MGTELQKRGLGKGVTPDSWNITNPEQVKDVHKSYIQAGADAILTNTFGANSARISKESKYSVRELNLAGVKIARECAGENVLIFGDIGPTGWEDQLPPYGTLSEEAFYEVFSEQAKTLAEGGVDAIIIETMADVAEAACAVRASRETGLPVVACMVYASGKNRDRTMMGVTPEQAARELTAAGADVIGANCGQGIAGYIEICRRLRAATDLPLWIKPNAGLPELVDGRAVYRTTPEEFAAHVPALLDAGASFVGGCCGTSPAFLRAVAAKVRERRGK